jgi:glucose/arabinose dehydrogenase
MKLKIKYVVLIIFLFMRIPGSIAQTSQWELAEGFLLERVATGLDLPVNIAFVPNPEYEPDAPLYYVTELYGKVKVILHNGKVQTYADSLLNFTPSGEFPGTGEIGLTGIVIEPESGDIFVTMAYEDEDYQEFGLRKNRVIRLQSTDGGLTAAEAIIILDNIPGLVSGPYASHQIQDATIGPDGKLYVQIGDGFLAYTAQQDQDLRGKILRMNFDGSIPADNPNPNSYVYAKGVRNPFGGAWRMEDGTLYISDNGPSENDRLAKVEAGANLGWPMTMLDGAIKLWNPTVAPTAIAFCYTKAFPDSLQGRLFVGLSGPTYWPGQTPRGKRIEMFSLADDGTVIDEAIFLQNVSDSSRSTVVGLAFGPDGLYFTDLYGEEGFDENGQTSANIYRISPICNTSPFNYRYF